MSKPVVPLTVAGMLVVALGVSGYIGGWRLGWVEFMVVAAGCLHRGAGRVAVRDRPDAS